MANWSNDLPSDKDGQESLSIKGFIKYDLIEEKIVKKVDFGHNKWGGEVQWAPKEGQYGSREEDDGYLMTVIYDSNTKKSHFAMWDSKNLEEKPFLTADIKERVPYGFHSLYVPEKDME